MAVAVGYAQSVLRGRQRDVDDGGVQHDHQLGERDEQQGDPAPGVRRAGCRCGRRHEEGSPLREAGSLTERAGLSGENRSRTVHVPSLKVLHVLDGIKREVSAESQDQRVRPWFSRDDGRNPATLVAHTSPAHGSLSVDPDGSFRYVPAAGFTGTDTFTYTVSDAVHLYSTHLPPLARIGGVPITGGAYGSSLAPVPGSPGSPGEYYGLTDRGPNVDGPVENEKILPLPKFQPAIGRFRPDRRRRAAGARHPAARRGRHPVRRAGEPAGRHRRGPRRPERRFPGHRAAGRRPTGHPPRGTGRPGRR